MMKTNYRTMADVAAAAQVSLKTVSRVVNNEKGVGAETRARVQAHILAGNFRANDAARSLTADKARRYKTIGFLCHTSIVHYYFSELQAGVMTEARRRGFQVMLEQVGHLTDGAILRERLRDMRIDGAVLHPRSANDALLLDALDDLQIPYVRVSPIDRGLRSSCVGIDEFQAAYDMTDHIIREGHTDIGYIRLGLPGVETGERERGYLAAMRAHGLAERPDWTLACGWDILAFVPVLERFLMTDNRPTAIFAASDKIAFCALGIATKLRMRVPEDISIAGFDDNPGWESTWPPLTTVHHPIADLGVVATSHVLDILECKTEMAPRNIELPYAVVIRNSIAKR